MVYISESLKIAKRLSITDLFTGMVSRLEIVCTFLAVLELIKLNRIAAVQDAHFGEIMVEARDPDAEAAMIQEEVEESDEERMPIEQELF